MATVSRLTLVPVLVYGSAEALVRGLNLLFLPLLTRLFSADQFGEIALLVTIMGFVGLLANCGLGNAVHRFYFEPAATSQMRLGTISAGFWTLMSMCVACVSLAYVVLWGVGSISGLGLPLMLCLLAVLPTQLVQFGQDVLRLYSAHWQYLFVAVLKTLFAFSIGLGLVYWFDAGVTGYFFGLLAGQLILLVWIMASLRSALRNRPDSAEVTRLVRYGSPFVVAGVAQWLISSTDLWVLGALRGTADVGVYSLCLKLATVVSFVTVAFGLAWSPEILRLHAEDPDYRSIAGNTLLQLAAFLFFFATAATIVMPFVFEWLIPPEYGRPLLVITLLTFSTAVTGTCQVTVLGMVFEKRSDLIAKINWGVAIFSVIFSWLLVSIAGIWGAAISNLTTAILLTSSYFMVTRSIHPLKFSSREIRFFAMFASCCVLLVVTVVLNDGAGRGVIWHILLLGILFAWMWKSGRWSRFFTSRRPGAF